MKTISSNLDDFIDEITNRFNFRRKKIKSELCERVKNISSFK